MIKVNADSMVVCRETSRFLLILPVCALLMAPQHTEAAGYQLRQQGADGLGTALAGVSAGANGLGDMYWNPAVAGMRDQVSVAASITYLRPVSEAREGEAASVLGTPVPGRGAQDDVTPSQAIPAAYFAAPVQERLNVGLAINPSFGLETDYGADWVGRYHALNSEVLALSFNPTLAYRASERVTLAGGFIAQYFDTKLSNAVDFGTIGAVSGIPGALPGGQDGSARLEADDWGFGFNLGVLAEPVDGTRLGLSYRSEIRHSLRGDARFTFDEAGIGAALSGATGAFADTPVRSGIRTPAFAALGLAQDLTPDLTLLAEVQWAGWSAFDDLVVRFDNPAQPAEVTAQNWNDSWFAALGLAYRPDTRWTLRAGVAFGESPVPDNTRTPRIPDADRTWLSGGLGYAVAEWLRLDLSYTRIFMSRERITLTADQPGNSFRGDLDFRSDTSVDVVALAGTLRF